VSPDLDALRHEVVKYAREASARGLVPNTAGNFSARDPATQLIAISPHDYPYEIMTPDDVVIVAPDGRRVEGRLPPSFETPVHCVVYRERPQVNGIVHTEPIYVNCFGALGRPIKSVVLSLALAVGETVPVMPFAPSGSESFGRRMLDVMADRNAVIWGNHGLLTVGDSLPSAFRCTVTVETAAQIYYLALLLGQPTLVSPDRLKTAHG
jgi:ribulose-5-phosphate 4-epimerase/fuculose-1-phosphate aldolase